MGLGGVVQAARLFVEVSTTVLVGIISDVSQDCSGRDRGRSVKEERAPTRAGVEVVSALALDDVAPTSSWWIVGQGQVGGQVRPVCCRALARIDRGQCEVCGGCSGCDRAQRHPIPPLPDQGPVFNLEEKVFCRDVRYARKAAAGGPSGMTNDHLRPLLNNMMDTRSLFKVAELLSKGQVPPLAAQTIKLGRMTGVAQGPREACDALFLEKLSGG